VARSGHPDDDRVGLDADLQPTGQSISAIHHSAAI
jgi:hypothetical protein